jgi:hypothetical protein
LDASWQDCPDTGHSTCRIYDLSQRCSHWSQLYHAHIDCYANLLSQIHGHMLCIYGHSPHLHATLQHDIPWN